MSQDLKYWHLEIEKCDSLKQWDDMRLTLLGKTGSITLMLKELGKLAPEDRKARGAQINQLKESVSHLLEAKKESLMAHLLQDRLKKEAIDITLPARPEKTGSIHALSQTLNEVAAYFKALGFTLKEGPDIEDEDHNFTALNIPDHHPARQSHDTFYLPPDEKGMARLLRTHTSTVQIRTMRSCPPPLRILAMGRVYRCDYDATHTPMFHQVEGLVIDKSIHMGHLKGCIEDFLRHFFAQTDLPVRLRPSFFPFTEPSAEVDIGCSRKDGQLKIGAGHDWLEILGCGMVHPTVLENCGIDPDIYQGFAFGIGLDRLTMLKYGIPDLRSFFDSDTRWLKHYGFSAFSCL